MVQEQGHASQGRDIYFLHFNRARLAIPVDLPSIDIKQFYVAIRQYSLFPAESGESEGRYLARRQRQEATETSINNYFESLQLASGAKNGDRYCSFDVSVDEASNHDFLCKQREPKR
jgi:hypothetical protein